MNEQNRKGRALQLLVLLTRKAQTLFSLAHSAALVWQDGLDWRSLDHDERLHYLELRSALNYKPGIVVYDIGANFGEFASFLAKLGSVSAIYCFEPVEHVFRELLKRTRDYKKISCFPVALGDQSGRQRMYVHDFHASSSLLLMEPLHYEELPHTQKAHEAEVSVLTLEEAVEHYHLPAPDFIKFDVQGFEDRVIRGGMEVVKKARFCMIELSLACLYQDSLLLTEINSLMRSLGFHLVRILGKIVGQSGEILQFDGLYRNDRAKPITFP